MEAAPGTSPYGVDTCQPPCYRYMSRKGKRRVALKRSYYPLTEVIQRIDDGRCDIRQNASECAFSQFGWERDDIIRALKLLDGKHFCKSITSRRNRLWVYDVYRARLLGEKVYIHLYVDDTKGRVIINSFKRE